MKAISKVIILIFLSIFLSGFLPNEINKFLQSNPRNPSSENLQKEHVLTLADSGISRTDKIDVAISILNEILQSSSGKLQKKRILTLTEFGLSRIENVDLAISILKEDIEKLQPQMLEALNESELAEDKALIFNQFTFNFDDQILSANIDLSFHISETALLRGSVYLSAGLASNQDSLVANYYAHGFEVKKVTGVASYKEVVTKEIIEVLEDITPIINAVLDNEINNNSSKATLINFDVKEMISTNLSEESSDEFQFNNNPINIGLDTRHSAIEITPKGIVLLADINWDDPEKVGIEEMEWPVDRDVIQIESKDYQSRLENYKTKFNKVYQDAIGVDDSLFLDKNRTGIAISKASLSDLLNFALSSAEIRGTYKLREQGQSTEPITLKLGADNCSDYFKGCDFKNICEGNRCEKLVTTNWVDSACVAGCCGAAGLIGCASSSVRRGCKNGCRKVSHATQPIAGVICNRFRSHNKLSRETLCKYASNVDVAVCKIDANARSSLCKSVKEMGRHFEKEPLASITIDFNAEADIQISLPYGNFASDLSKLSANINLTGSGSVKAGIRYKRNDQNYFNMMQTSNLSFFSPACKFNWKETVDPDVTLQNLSKNISFDVHWSEEETSINGEITKFYKLEFKQNSDNLLYLDFKPSPLMELFGKKPQVTLNCPLIGTGAALFGSSEAILTDRDARKVLPLITGKNFPLNIDALSMEVSIKPGEICLGKSEDKCISKLVLKPKISKEWIMFY